MTKKSTKAVSAKKSTKAVEIVDVPSLVAAIADREGIAERDVVKFPALVTPYKLAVEVITDEVIEKAVRINRAKVEAARAVIEAHNATIVPPAPAVEVIEETPAGEEVAEKAPSSASPAIKPKKATKDKSAAETKPEKALRVLAFGRYPATAVIRWMGVNGMSVDQAVAVMAGLGLVVSIDTIRIQLRAGAKNDGSRGEPAALAADEIKKVKKFAKNA